MKKYFGLALLFLLVSCSLYETPDGKAELSESSISTRLERPTTTEEIVYCTADVKVTNTGDKPMYSCTITAVAKSNLGIEHYISLTYDVNLKPSQSIYLTLEWHLVRQIETANVSSSLGNTSGYSNGSSYSSSSHSSTHTTGTSENEVTVIPNGEIDWDKTSVKILDYFFS